MGNAQPPLAYILRRASALAETGEFSSYIDVEAALVREGHPEAVEALAARPAFRDYLIATCARAQREKTNAPRS